jgi:hypothetical protein
LPCDVRDAPSARVSATATAVAAADIFIVVTSGNEPSPKMTTARATGCTPMA